MTNNVLRRAALVVFCFTVFLSFRTSADSYHPHIVKSQVVTLDAAAIERNANNGTPFELVLGETRLNVVLAPAPVWPKEGVLVLDVDRDGVVKKRLVEGNITYAGEVVGEDPEECEARFTIAYGVVDGYVLSKTGWWFIEPLSRFAPKAASNEYLVYTTRDLDFVLEYGDDGLNEEIYEPWGGEPAPDGRIPLVMVADHPYATYAGSVPYEARHATLVNRINGIYNGQSGRQFKIVVSIADFGNTFLDPTDGHALLTRLKLFVDHAGGGASNPNGPGLLGLMNLNAYFAHLTAGKDLGGNTAGVAVQNGRFGLSQQALIPLGSGETGLALSFQNTMLAAHEIGHNFNALHKYAECICVDDGWFGCNDYQRTLMWHEFISDNLPRFSSTNRQRVRDFMSEQSF